MHRTARIRAVAALAGVLGLLVIAAREHPAWAADPKKSAAAPAQAAPAGDAKALLRSVGERYRALKSYEFDGTSRMEMTVQGRTQTIEVPFRLAVRKPDKLLTVIDNPMMSVVRVSDGQQTWVYVPQAGQYTQSAATPMPTQDGVDLGGALAVGTPLQRYLAVDEHLSAAKFVGTSTIQLGARKVPVSLVEARYAVPESAKVEMSPNLFWIDRTAKMIVRDSVFVVIEGPGGMPASIATVTSFDRARMDQAVHDSVFAFNPPDGAKRVESISLPGQSEPESPFVGKPAEDFTLVDLAGKQQRLGALKGKVVLLDFWATWCGPCRREMPNIVKLHKELAAKGLAVVAVNVGEEATAVKTFLNKNGYTLPVWLDKDSKVSLRYDARSIPTLVVIDREGVVSSYMVGLRGEDDLRAALVKAGLQ